MPLPIVLATCVPRTKAATKLKNAAQITAFCGDSTRVETTVAIEFAASWKPLRKSKTRATRTMRTMRAMRMGPDVRSGVLDDHVPHDVRVVLALVAGVLQAFVDLLPLQDLQRIAAGGLEEVGDHRVVKDVGAVLEVGDAHDAFVDLALVGEVPDHLGDPVDLDRHLHQD